MRGIGILRWIAIAAMMASVPVPAWAGTAVIVDATRMPGAAATPNMDIRDVVPADSNLVVVPYPAQTWPLSGPTSHTAGYSTQVGAELLCQTLPDQTGRVTVFGLSLGSMTIDRFLANLPSDLPAPDSLSFVVMGDPFRGGVLAGFPATTYLPLLEFAKPVLAETPYDVVVIQNQYDAIGDFPDRPWNLVAVLNAVVGGMLYHNAAAYRDAATQVQNGSVAPISIEVNSQGGTTTTYVVPRPIAITTVLKLIGLPEPVADVLDTVLKPMVAAGYSRNDLPSASSLPASTPPAPATATGAVGSQQLTSPADPPSQEPAADATPVRIRSSLSPISGSPAPREMQQRLDRSMHRPAASAASTPATSSPDEPSATNPVKARHRAAA